MKPFMPRCSDCNRRLRRKQALDPHLPIPQIKWLYTCGGCFEEFVYFPFEAKVQPKEEWEAERLTVPRP